MLPEGILHQSWSREYITIIFINYTNRQETDKAQRNRKKGKKLEKKTKNVDWNTSNTNS